MFEKKFPDNIGSNDYFIINGFDIKIKVQFVKILLGKSPRDNFNKKIFYCNFSVAAYYFY